jgi:pimeloyl-ACP methyl ester carboxylesterase
MTADFAFLHGGGQGGWIWDETLAALHSQTRGAFGRAIALDVPGCGAKRDRDTTDFDMEDTANELLSDVVASGMRDIVLVGHSQAGTVLPLMTQRRPDLFRRLVYVTCSIPSPGQTILQMMGSGLHGSNPDEVGWLIDPKAGKRREHYRSMFCNDMTEAEASALLSKLGADNWPNRVYAFSDWRPDTARVPATYIVCLQDNVLPVAWQEIFAARFNAERRVRIDAGHQVMNSRPHTLAEVLRHEAV